MKYNYNFDAHFRPRELLTLVSKISHNTTYEITVHQFVLNLILYYTQKKPFLYYHHHHHYHIVVIHEYARIISAG